MSEKESLRWNRSSYNGRNKAISTIMDYRWAISRFAHFSKATYFYELTGPITPFEVMLVFIIAIISIVVVALSSKTDSGKITQYLILFSVLVALKNNALQFVLGVSWERAILFHKCVATLSLICACIHGIPQLTGAGVLHDSKQVTGLALLILLSLQPLLYICVRPLSFEFFYYLHLLVYIVMVCFAMLHGAIFVLISLCFFCLDLIIRYSFNSRRVTLSVQQKPGNVVQITFEKRFHYHAGQYVYLMIPALGVHEWHPFSISSAPHELLISLHVGISGDWTQRLADLTLPANANNTDNANGVPIELTAFVEGPYGLSAVNFEDSTYQIVLLISGSIGVTPNQSIANDLLEAHRQGRPLKKIVYVWAMRDKNLGLVKTMRQSGQLPGASSLYPFSFSSISSSSPSSSPSSSFTSATPVDCVLQTDIYVTDNLARSTTREAVQNPLNDGAEVELSELESADSAGSNDKNQHARIANSDNHNTSTNDKESVVVTYGRPDFTVIFGQVRELAVSQNERRVAVSVCGSASMVESATSACRAITSREVQFDIHIEKFSL